MLSILDSSGLTLPLLLFCYVILLGAGFVRGYSGFGFSALTVTGLSLLLLPKEVVPVVLCLEILASLHMLPQAWRKADWRLIMHLIAGATIATPLGVWLLVLLPERAMRITLSLVVLGLCWLLWRGVRITAAEQVKVKFSAGLVSGLFNGAAALGGLPVVLFMLALATEAAVMRATTTCFFLLTELLALAVTMTMGLFDQHTLIRVVLFAIPMTLGVMLGSRHFVNTNPENFRHFVLILLLTLATIGLIRALIS